MKWETFKEKLVQIKDNAQAYENAYNGIRASIEQQEGIKQVLQALPLPAKIQVSKEKERLVEARRMALSEKRAYVQVRISPRYPPKNPLSQLASLSVVWLASQSVSQSTTMSSAHLVT